MDVVSLLSRNTCNSVKVYEVNMKVTKSWTAEEIKFIRDHKETLTTSEMSSRMNKSRTAVYSKMRRLGMVPIKGDRTRINIDIGHSRVPRPNQHRFDLKVGDVITAPYRSKSADYIGRDENTFLIGTKICKYTVTAIYPHIFQARLEETSDAGVIRELTKNAYISGEIKKYRPKSHISKGGSSVEFF